MIYIFIKKPACRETRLMVDLRDDLTARRYANLNSDCIRVETESARVEWRRAEEQVAPAT